MDDYELRAILDELREAGGSGTWHISLYVRPEKSVQSVKNRISQEVSEAESIKSDDTRDRVQSSLSTIHDVLSRYSETPPNGLVIFAAPDDVTVLDDLPFECPENRYHCGKSFLLDPLDAGFESGGEYGLIVVERGRAAIGVLSGGRIVKTVEKESNVMGKSKAGGFSDDRFDRERERQLHEFFLDVQETASAIFGGYDLDGVVIGGTLSSAKGFADGYTNHEWDVLGTYSVDHGDTTGLSELAERASERILDEEVAEVRATVERFVSGLRDDSATAVAYGRDEVTTKLERGAVDTLLLSTSLDRDEIRDLSEQAESMGGSVVVVDPSFEAAEMFEQIGDGYGAILRW